MSRFVTRRDFLKVSAVSALGAAATAAFGAGALAEDAKAVYTPGTYSASEQGLESLVTVTMTFDETSIVDVVVDSSGETAEIGAAAAETLAEQLKNAQAAEIDGVTGATVTGNAVKKAAASCIAQAMGLAVEEEAAEATAGGDDWLGAEPEITDADVYAEASADVVVVGLG
ncbi:MAG: FMN-binding protein, partial [Clostridia bacterium]|nr:FMN-binding protein [Clostridia bacterium]